MTKEKTELKPKSLAKGSIIYGIGNIGTLVINFFLVPLYTFYLTNEELGYFDLVASSLILFAPIFFGHVELAVIRWTLSSKDKENLTKVVTNSLIIFIVGLIIFSIVYFSIDFFVTLKLAPYVFLYFISNFFYIIAKQIVRSVYSSSHYVFTELTYILIVLFCTIFLVQNHGLKAIFIAYGFASLAFLVYLLFLKINKYISFAFLNFNTCKELLTYSFPLVLNAISLWLNNQSSKYLIATFLTLSANGIYAIAFKIAYVIQIFNRIFYYSFQDKLYAVFGKEGFQEYFANTIKTYSVILFSLWYMMIGVQQLALPLVIDAKFLSAMNYIPILGLGIVFMSLSSVLGIIYQCVKKNINAFKTSLLSGLIIVLLGFLVIPKYDLLGASIVFTFGNFIWLLYRFIDIQKFVAVKMPYMKFALYTVIGLLIWSISYFETLLSYISSFVVALIISLFLNKEILLKYSSIIYLKFKR